MRQDPAQALEIFDGTDASFHPKDIVDCKARRWHRTWATPISDPSEAMGNVLKVAREAVLNTDPLPVLEDPDLRKALKAMKPRAGLGVDRLTPCDMERLPDQGLEVLASLPNSIEHLLAWPAQTMLAIGRLLPKKVSGGRVISLISMLSRVWSMSREPWVRSWSSRSEPHWGAA
eukprot:1437691-Pyramimonas_sp.AAC.1